MAAVEGAEDEEESAPPHVGVKMIEDDGILGRMRKLVEARSENQQAVHYQRDADEKPDRDGALRIHSITRI